MGNSAGGRNRRALAPALSLSLSPISVRALTVVARHGGGGWRGARVGEEGGQRLPRRVSPSFFFESERPLPFFSILTRAYPAGSPRFFYTQDTWTTVKPQ